MLVLRLLALPSGMAWRDSSPLLGLLFSTLWWRLHEVTMKQGHKNEMRLRMCFSTDVTEKIVKKRSSKHLASPFRNLTTPRLGSIYNPRSQV